MQNEPTDLTTARAYPGARRPDRTRRVDSHGVSLAVIEWGEAEAPPVLLAHGGFDFAGTFDTFAPLIADAGWRVVGWDQRGHGDSEYAALYTWDADVRDALAVLHSVGQDPIPVIGHSKGGGLMMQLAHSAPHLVSAVVNLDGMPSYRSVPDVADRERAAMMADELAGWLDHRRAKESARRPGTIDELAARRGRMNPRLPMDWLQYLVTVGARQDEDGWRWKLDPAMRMGGFGPWRPEWSIPLMAGLGMAFLGILGLEYEEMGWGTKPADVQGKLPPGAEFHALEDTGHFIHVERPQEVSEIVLEFLR